MSKECLSKDVHGGGFWKKSVGELESEGLHWVCSIPGTSLLWGTLRLKTSKAFLQVFSHSQSQWGDGLHCALLGQERGEEDGKGKRSSNEHYLRCRGGIWMRQLRTKNSVPFVQGGRYVIV